MHRQEKRRKSTSNMYANNSLLFMMYEYEFTCLPEVSLTKSRMSSATDYCDKLEFWIWRRWTNRYCCKNWRGLLASRRSRMLPRAPAKSNRVYHGFLQIRSGVQAKHASRLREYTRLHRWQGAKKAILTRYHQHKHVPFFRKRPGCGSTPAEPTPSSQ